MVEVKTSELKASEVKTPEASTALRRFTVGDLAAKGLTGKQFRFVRIVDAKTKITDKSEFWGADIDAVVALHTTSSR